MSGNRDDHSKNFSFMMSDKGEWMNSPAYDVIYNPGMNGEHTMDINAKGKNFVLDDINRIGKEFSISKKDIATMIQEISESLSSWNVEAHHYAIPKEQVLDISRHINSQRKPLTPRPPASENTLLKS
jgi:serine/threonine-protein kinase HipA